MNCSRLPEKISLNSFLDDRGEFTRLYEAAYHNEIHPEFMIKNINLSSNPKMYTLRGMHYQRPPSDEIKIISCLTGEIFDVAVDINQSSPNYLKYWTTHLNGKKREAFIVPSGYAHGFLTLASDTTVIYSVNKEHSPEHECRLAWNDPLVKIPWPHKPTLVSQKDSNTSFLI